MMALRFEYLFIKKERDGGLPLGFPDEKSDNDEVAMLTVWCWRFPALSLLDVLLIHSYFSTKNIRT
jgi:hypothetical protein